MSRRRGGVAVWNSERSGPRAEKALDHKRSRRRSGAGQSPGGADRAADRQRQPHPGPCCRARLPGAPADTGLAETITVKFNGTAGQASAPSGAAFARPRGRRQRLCRQGPVGRPRGGAPAQGVDAQSAGEHHRRQHRALRRDRRRGLLRGRRGRALCRAQFGRGLGRRGHRRSRLRVHDGRRRGRAGRHRAQPPACRAASPRLRQGALRDLYNTAMVELEPIGAASGDKDDPARPHQRASGVEDDGMGDMLRFTAHPGRAPPPAHRQCAGARCSRTGTTLRASSR